MMCKKQGKSRLKLDPSCFNSELFFVRTCMYLRTQKYVDTYCIHLYNPQHHIERRTIGVTEEAEDTQSPPWQPPQERSRQFKSHVGIAGVDVVHDNGAPPDCGSCSRTSDQTRCLPGGRRYPLLSCFFGVVAGQRFAGVMPDDGLWVGVHCSMVCIFFQFSHLPKLGVFTQLPKVNCVKKQLWGKVGVEKTQLKPVQKNQEISPAFPQPPAVLLCIHVAKQVFLLRGYADTHYKMTSY